MKSSFWKNKEVLITGGDGFIGSFILEKLINLGAKITITYFPKINKKNIKPYLKKIKTIKVDLTNKNMVLRKIDRFDAILHLAGIVGSIDFNKQHPASMFVKNIEMTINILEAARLKKTKRVLLVSSGTVYTPQAPLPYKEEDGFLGVPHENNAGYAWAKRMTEFLGKSYFQEFGINVAIVRPDNIYGPRDHFDPETSHVIPSLIYKISKNKIVEVWGSGNQKRTFTYVDDIAEGMLLAIEKYAVADPVNLSSNETTTIKNLAKMIVKIMNKKVKLIFDTSKPEGHKTRSCDTKKAEKVLGFKAKTKLTDGLKKAINYWQNEK